MEVRTNPIVVWAQRERQRAAAAGDPGHFHGGVAKRAIHRCDSRHEAWITFGEPSCWKGWSAARGEQLALRDYEECHVPWDRASDDDEPSHCGWFQGGLTNAASNEVGRHVLAGHGDEAAFIVEGDHWDEAADTPAVSFRVSRARLLLETVTAALVPGSLGLGKGDRVALNIANIVEQVYDSEAAKHLGVLDTPVFGGFAAKTLSDRIADAGGRVLVTADGSYRHVTLVRSEKGAVAVPSDFMTVSELSETRSGKYVRRLLAALSQGEGPGDLSSLRNPDVLRGIEPKVTAWRNGEAERR